ncbi:MAG: hypothetical protein K8W52_38025 [Deltaproteobacteria bacterium]|nr:hypothetical protein [Deltaproteobacteria bacterium]
MQLRSVLLAASLAIAACSGAKDDGARPAASSTGDRVIAVGATAPASALTAPTGESVALSDRLAKRDQTIVVFYRGFF